MKHVLLISRALIPSVTLCGHDQLTLLAAQGKLEYRQRSPLRIKDSDILWADVLVFVRSDDDVCLFIARTARKLGKVCMYVLDDDLLNIPEGLDSSAHYGREETRALLRQNMAACSVFLSPSRNLIRKYGDEFERCVRIEEPATVCPRREAPSGPVKIGFAGSIDRAGDIDVLLSGAVRRVLAKYGERVSITFFGAKPAVAEELSLPWIPYQDSYEKYVETMCALGWDIGLAPMPDTPFHRCKHYNKFTEYASYGIAGIYSRVEPYTFAVRDGENGLLCPNTEDGWFDSICRLVEDDGLRRRISRECLREAGEQYSPEATARIWEELIDTFPVGERAAGTPLRFWWGLFCARVRWVFRKLRAWGWKAPRKLVQKIWKRLVRT